MTEHELQPAEDKRTISVALIAFSPWNGTACATSFYLPPRWWSEVKMHLTAYCSFLLTFMLHLGFLPV